MCAVCVRVCVWACVFVGGSFSPDAHQKELELKQALYQQYKVITIVSVMLLVSAVVRLSVGA